MKTIVKYFDGAFSVVLFSTFLTMLFSPNFGIMGIYLLLGTVILKTLFLIVVTKLGKDIRTLLSLMFCQGGTAWLFLFLIVPLDYSRIVAASALIWMAVIGFLDRACSKKHYPSTP